MRVIYFLFCLCCIGVLNSCSTSVYDISVDGFNQLEQDLLKKFGHSSYFTDLTIRQDNEKQIEISLLVTSNPYTYKMEGWNYKNRDWQKVTEVDLELVKGDIINYLYTIDQEVSVIKMGYLIDLCIQKAKKNGERNIRFNRIDIISPNDGNKSKMGYSIYLTVDENKINYLYTLEGDLIRDPKL